jgi:hypothetical protein
MTDRPWEDASLCQSCQQEEASEGAPFGGRAELEEWPLSWRGFYRGRLIGHRVYAVWVYGRGRVGKRCLAEVMEIIGRLEWAE